MPRVTEKMLREIGEPMGAEIFVDRGAFRNDRVRITINGERKGFKGMKDAYDYIFSINPEEFRNMMNRIYGLQAK